MDNTINERLKTVLHQKRLSSSEFSEAVGISRSTLSAIINSKARPSYEVLEKIAATFPEINAGWLLTGNGSMMTVRLPEVAGTAEAPAQIQAEGNSEAAYWQMRYAELVRERDMVQAQAEALKDVLIKLAGKA